MKIGDKVKLLEDVNMPGYMLFEKGHEFTIYGSSYRGWDLIDKNGKKLDETLFISDKLELVK